MGGNTSCRAQAAKANNKPDSDPQSLRNSFDLRQGSGILVGLPCIAYRNRPASNRIQRTRMRTYTFIAFGLLLLSAACAGPAPLQSSAPLGIRPSQAAPMRISAEAEHLRGILAQDVPQRTSCAASEQTWIAAAQAAVANARIAIERPQLVIAVDRNPHRQELCILLARTDAPWQVIGGSKVSTGQAGRRGYFITPTGVFLLLMPSSTTGRRARSMRTASAVWASKACVCGISGGNRRSKVGRPTTNGARSGCCSTRRTQTTSNHVWAVRLRKVAFAFRRP